MRRFAIVVAALGLAACSVTEVRVQKMPASASMVQSAKTLIGGALRDPASAQYRNFVSYAVGEGQTLLCGELNAKNGFGGYNGFGDFFVVFNGAGKVERYFVDGLQSWPNAANVCGSAENGSFFR